MQILSVEQATGYIRDVLAADALLADLWLCGELSNLSRSAAGHCYFTLKDASSQLRCVLFRHRGALQAYRPADGDQVIVNGHISLYPATGSLQLYVDLVQPAGVGAAHLRFERLRQGLAAEGLFDEGRKRRLPTYPRCIGVVTSAHGAVWHDIATIVARRYPLAELVLAPALVQGEGAPASIVEGLRRLWLLPRCDVIIVGRGGGSAEDLAAFNDEAVARAIYASPVPVISAVGHEVDVTIADFVADVRAPTPSAAAELAVPDRAQLLAGVVDLGRRLRARLGDRLAEGRDELDHAAHHLQRAVPRSQLVERRRQVEGAHTGMVSRLRLRLERRRRSLAALDGQLRALDPRAVLGRGYAVVSRQDGRPLLAADGLAAGERLRVRLRDGDFGARVEAPSGEAP